jgi:acetyltransferase EpsM
MPAAELIVIGGGEHARVVAEAASADAGQWKLLGFVDPVARPDTVDRGALHQLGDDKALRDHPRARAILGFGGVEKGKARENAVQRLASMVSRWATVVHPRAIVSPSAKLGGGTPVMAGAIVQTGANIGEHVIINSGAIIEHDVAVGDYSQISPGAAIGGAARLGRQVFVGLGAVIRDHVAVGDETVVGMGAVVVSDVPARSVVIGVPAKPLAD